MGINALSYVEGLELIEALGIENEYVKREAFAAHFAKQWYIFYNDRLVPRKTIKFYLAHELGHILLGHEMEIANKKNRQVTYSKNNPINTWEDIFEKDADMFAIRLLAPAGVLAALNIKDAEDIEYLCCLTAEAAHVRIQRMNILYKRNLFGKSKLENRLLLLFMILLIITKRLNINK